MKLPAWFIPVFRRTSSGGLLQSALGFTGSIALVVLVAIYAQVTGAPQPPKRAVASGGYPVVVGRSTFGSSLFSTLPAAATLVESAPLVGAASAVELPPYDAWQGGGPSLRLGINRISRTVLVPLGSQFAIGIVGERQIFPLLDPTGLPPWLQATVGKSGDDLAVRLTVMITLGSVATSEVTGSTGAVHTCDPNATVSSGSMKGTYVSAGDGDSLAVHLSSRSGTACAYQMLEPASGQIQVRVKATATAGPAPQTCLVEGTQTFCLPPVANGAVTSANFTDDGPGLLYEYASAITGPASDLYDDVRVATIHEPPLVYLVASPAGS